MDNAHHAIAVADSAIAMRRHNDEWFITVQKPWSDTLGSGCTLDNKDEAVTACELLKLQVALAELKATRAKRTAAIVSFTQGEASWKFAVHKATEK